MNYFDGEGFGGDEITTADRATFRRYMRDVVAAYAGADEDPTGSDGDGDPEPEVVMLSNGYAEIWPDGDVVQGGALILVVDEDGDPDEDETLRRLQARS